VQEVSFDLPRKPELYNYPTSENIETKAKIKMASGTPDINN
jgi:hypothetical protein